jgi:hypothetical protein
VLTCTSWSRGSPRAFMVLGTRVLFDILAEVHRALRNMAADAEDDDPD